MYVGEISGVRNPIGIIEEGILHMVRKANAQFWYYNASNDSFDVSPLEETSTIVALRIIQKSALPLANGSYTQSSIMSREMVASKIIDAEP